MYCVVDMDNDSKVLSSEQDSCENEEGRADRVCERSASFIPFDEILSEETEKIERCRLDGTSPSKTFEGASTSNSSGEDIGDTVSPQSSLKRAAEDPEETKPKAVKMTNFPSPLAEKSEEDRKKAIETIPVSSGTGTRTRPKFVQTRIESFFRKLKSTMDETKEAGTEKEWVDEREKEDPLTLESMEICNQVLQEEVERHKKLIAERLMQKNLIDKIKFLQNEGKKFQEVDFDAWLAIEKDKPDFTQKLEALAKATESYVKGKFASLNEQNVEIPAKPFRSPAFDIHVTKDRGVWRSLNDQHQELPETMPERDQTKIRQEFEKRRRFNQVYTAPYDERGYDYVGPADIPDERYPRPQPARQTLRPISEFEYEMNQQRQRLQYHEAMESMFYNMS